MKVSRAGCAAGLVVGYSLARCAAVWQLLGDLGVDPLLFAAIDVATALPYAKAWPRFADAVSRRSLGAGIAWLLIALVSFAAPYAYLALAAPTYSSGVEGGLVIFALLAAVSAGIGAIRAVRGGRGVRLGVGVVRLREA